MENDSKSAERPLGSVEKMFDESYNFSGCKLASIVSGSNGIAMEGTDKYRNYISSFETTATIYGKKDVSTKTIQYQIGAHLDPKININLNMSRKGKSSLIVKTTTFQMEYFCNYAKRYSAFVSDFSCMDLSALIYILARGLASYANYGILTPAMLSDNKPLKVIALLENISPFTASSSHIFIPRSCDSMSSPNVFCALVNASTNCDSTVITDALTLDYNSHRVMVPYCENAELAEGCYQALRIIGSNYSRLGRGDIFSLCVTAGVHQEVTVVGHTDEGGYLRDVLRSVRFCTSFGAINVGERDYCGMPRPISFDLRQTRHLVDSIALATAAAVAYADPLVEIKGRKYPRLYCVDVGCNMETGINDESGKESNAYNLSAKIANDCSDFCMNYIRALVDIFCIKTIDITADVVLINCFNNMRQKTNRHLTATSVTPFFWIEPTSILYLNPNEYDAAKYGYASICSPFETIKKPFFEKVQVKKDNGMYSLTFASWRSARTNALILHLSGHCEDGLALMRPFVMDPNNIVQPGGDSISIQKRMVSNATVDQYMWVRGQSCIPCPGETIYTGEGIGFKIKHYVIDQDNWSASYVHFPRTNELDGEVEFRVSKPQGYGNYILRWASKEVRTARSHAAMALDRARNSIDSPLNDLGIHMCFTDISFGDTSNKHYVEIKETCVNTIPQEVKKADDCIEQTDSSQHLGASKGDIHTIPVLAQAGRPSGNIKVNLGTDDKNSTYDAGPEAT